MQKNLSKLKYLSLKLYMTVLVPYTSNPGFVGRLDILDKVKNALRPSLQHKQSTSQARVALFGLGGIGYARPWQ
jgi:hypothetical protein